MNSTTKAALAFLLLAINLFIGFVTKAQECKKDDQGFYAKAQTSVNKKI